MDSDRLVYIKYLNMIKRYLHQNIIKHFYDFVFFLRTLQKISTFKNYFFKYATYCKFSMLYFVSFKQNFYFFYKKEYNLLIFLLLQNKTLFLFLHFLLKFIVHIFKVIFFAHDNVNLTPNVAIKTMITLISMIQN